MIIYTLILKQLPDFSSCPIFETYPGFKKINVIHINVNFQVCMHLRQNSRFFDKVKKYKQIENKKALFFFTALRNQNINITFFLQCRFYYKCGKLLV